MKEDSSIENAEEWYRLNSDPLPSSEDKKPVAVYESVSINLPVIVEDPLVTVYHKTLSLSVYLNEILKSGSPTRDYAALQNAHSKLYALVTELMIAVCLSQQIR